MGKRIPSWMQRRPIFREMISEFLGTFLICIFVIGLSAQNVLSYGTAGSQLSGALGTAFAVTLAIIMSGKMSGAHINPVMSLGFAWAGKFPWTKVPGYMLAQYLGGFAAAGLAYVVYKDALFSYSEGPYSMQTAAIWSSFPAPFVPLWNAFFDVVVSSALLCLTILAVADPKNMNVQLNSAPLLYGFLVMCIGCGFSYNDGNPMNPARDFAPRLFMLMSGWGDKVLYGPNYTWWWVPLVASHVGVIIGGTIYVLLIECHFPPEVDKETKDKIEPEPGSHLLMDDKLEVTSKF